MKRGFDLGVFSFFTTAISSVYLLTRNLGMTGRVWVMASHVIVAGNYALGVHYALNVKKDTHFAIYCSVFTVIWLIIAYVGWKLMTAVLREKHEEDSVYEFFTSSRPR